MRDDLQDEYNTLRGVIGLCMVLVFIGLICLARQAYGEEHHHPAADAPIHEQFYSKWMIPTPRTQSCCDLKDCYPTALRQRADGQWEARRRPSDMRDGLKEWVPFAAAKLEQNQTDPQESPDGRSHACISQHSDIVYCATLGAGI